MSAEPVELAPVRERIGNYEVVRPMPKWATALAAAQAEMPPIEKTRTATIKSDKGNYSYAYADLADIFAAVRPVLAKHELAVTQDVQIQDGKVLCYTTIWHSSGESSSFGPVSLGAGSTPQNAGSAITYARRYGLSAALGIATEEDDDAQQASKNPTKRKTPPSEEKPERSAPPQPSGKAVDGQAETGTSARKSSGATGGTPAADLSGGGPPEVSAFFKALEAKFPTLKDNGKRAALNALLPAEFKLKDLTEESLAAVFEHEELKRKLEEAVA